MGTPIEYSGAPLRAPWEGVRVAIFVTEWHRELVGMMAADAERVLGAAGVSCDRFVVPGAFEIPSALHFLFTLEGGYNAGLYDAAICLGAVVRGETPHFDYISRSVFQALQEVSARYEGELIVMNGILTTNTLEQALARADGTHSRKGEELAHGVLSMLRFQMQALDLMESRAGVEEDSPDGE